jgi:hypothetical protein
MLWDMLQIIFFLIFQIPDENGELGGVIKGDAYHKGDGHDDEGYTEKFKAIMMDPGKLPHLFFAMKKLGITS